MNKRSIWGKLLAIWMVIAMIAVQLVAGTPESQKKTNIYLVGDSTVCEYGDDTKNYDVERAGWGENIARYFDSSINVINLAISGRSARSFTYEEKYQTLLKNLQAGDYLFIQFGHNDEKADDLTSTETSKRYRHSSPLGDETTKDSYQYYLYESYIKVAREKGAIPILVTPIVRREFVEGKVKDSHYSAIETEQTISYDDSMRTLAERQKVVLIDLNAATTELYNKLGEEVAVSLHALYNANKENAVDNTHLNDYGSKVVAGLVAEGVKASNLALKEKLKTEKQDQVTIYLVGDSTVCEYGDDSKNYDLERAGWGESLDHYFNHNEVKIVNVARSGRSARSLTYEENYQTVLDNIKEGDYLFIQFGHNDQKADDLTSTETSKLYRHSSPIGDETVEGSFQYYLYEYYIKMAREKGATPVLVTPIVRRLFEEGKVKDSHYSAVAGEEAISYDDAMRILAEKQKVTLIDLNAATELLYNTLGEERTTYLHAVYNETKGIQIDDTHLNDYGSCVVSELVAEGIRSSDLPLKSYLSPLHLLGK